MMLMRVPSVLGNEVIVSVLDHGLASGVTEIHLFLVVHKHILLDILDPLNVATFIGTYGGVEILISRMGDDFGAFLVFAACSLVVVALDVEAEVATAVDHLVVGLFVLLELF